MVGVPGLFCPRSCGDCRQAKGAIVSATGIEAEVCADIADRQRRGIAKYGVTVEDNPLSEEDWTRHAYEEALDLAIYLKRIMTLKRKTGPPAKVSRQ